MGSGLAGRGLYVAWPRAAAFDGQFSRAGRGAWYVHRHPGFRAKSGGAAHSWLAGFGHRPANAQRPCWTGVYVAWLRAAASDGQFSCAGRGAGASAVILIFAQSQAARPWLAGLGIFGKCAAALLDGDCMSLGRVPRPPMGNSHVPVGERGASAVITVFAQSQAARRVPGWRGLGVFGKWAAALTDGGVGRLAARRRFSRPVALCRGSCASFSSTPHPHGIVFAPYGLRRTVNSSGGLFFWFM